MSLCDLHTCVGDQLSCQGMTVQLPAGKEKSNIAQADYYSLLGSLLSTWDIQAVSGFQEGISADSSWHCPPPSELSQVPISKNAPAQL